MWKGNKKICSLIRNLCSLRLRRMNMKIKNSQFMKAIRVEKSILKELTFTDFEKCMLVINNTSTVEEKTSYRSINQKVFTVKNKITMNNGDDK